VVAVVVAWEDIGLGGHIQGSRLSFAQRGKQAGMLERRSRSHLYNRSRLQAPRAFVVG